MPQQLHIRLAEQRRRLRRLLVIWRQRDLRPWVVALIGIGLGLGTFLMLVALVEGLRFAGHF